MTTLAEAHQDLYQELQAAYRLDSEGHSMSALIAVLGPLESVVDHARRIQLDTASDHYRADKAGELLLAAVRLHRSAMANYAASISTDADDQVERIFALASQLTDQVTETIGRMWEVARGD